MVNLAEHQTLTGKLHTIEGNKPILLNDPETVWLVRSGSVAVFAVAIRNNRPQTRRYLFSCGSSAALFGTAIAPQPSNYQILAVPIGKTELLEVERSCFEQLVSDRDPLVRDLIEDWLDKFSTVLSAETVPEVETRISSGKQISLTKGHIFQPKANRFAWVQIDQGTVRWQGKPELTMTSQTPMFPLTSVTWLEAAGTVELTTNTTTSIRETESLLTGLSWFHARLLEYIKQLEQHERVAELKRLQAREHPDRRVTAKRKNLTGKLHTIKSNKPILLNDPQTVWLVRSGSIAVFAVATRDGCLGTRRYLFSCDVETALFGTAITAQPTNYQILAVPIGETELLEVEWSCFQQLVSDRDPLVRDLIEDWLDKFSTVLSTESVPAMESIISSGKQISLTKGQIFQPKANRFAWVQINRGAVHWQGKPELTMTSQTPMFPLTSIMWLEAKGTVQLTTNTTTSIRETESLLAGLAWFHARLLEYVKQLEQQERVAELKRLQARERLNRRVTVEALGNLASPLMDDDADLFVASAPLLAAAGAVGKAMGVNICPPAKSEDLQRIKEPLTAIARSSRLQLRQVLLRDNWWQEDCGALVAYTQGQQPVALLPVSATSYELYDPKVNRHIPLDETLADTISPVAYMFYRSFPDRVLSGLDIIKFGLLGRFFDILAIVLCGIAAALLGMVVPQATGIMIDHAIPDSDRGLLWQIGLGLLLAALATALFRLAQGFALIRVETFSETSTQAAMWDRLLNIPVSFYRSYSVGDLQSRVSSIGQMRRQLGGTMFIKLISGLFALLNLALLFFYSIKLALVATVTGIVVIIFTSLCGLILVRKVLPLLEIEGDIFGQVVQLINGVPKLRVSGAEERAFACWSKNYSQKIKLQLSTQLIEDLMAAFNTVIPTIATGLLFWFAVSLLTSDRASGTVGLTIGTFVAFNSAFKTFIGGATSISNTLTDVLQVTPQWERAQPIVKTVPEVELTKADPGKLIGRIDLERVSFRYQADRPLVLEDVTIRAEPGEFIALVGGSGSGKSTIMRLLLGFETPEAGSVCYDGRDLTGLNITTVRRQLGVVLQSNKILSGSIFDHLAGGANITLDEAWDAAQMAGIDQDIAAMPMKMHTVISEGGGNFSGGQRQRLAIAKALVLKPKILMFDEATSALDNKTQKIVSENLDRLQVTRIVIAHRLSTIRHADRICVLETGRVVQQGNFVELSNQKGVFQNLIQRQV